MKNLNPSYRLFLWLHTTMMAGTKHAHITMLEIHYETLISVSCPWQCPGGDSYHMLESLPEFRVLYNSGFFPTIITFTMLSITDYTILRKLS